MNKLKNIGISALAGSLVSLSAAQAGGVSVTGSWELSYTKLHDDKVTGNPLGMNKNITFGASGDVSDGGGVTWASTVAMGDSANLTSASMHINMGGIATLAYDSGTGGYGANSVDNVVPTAWEEIDYGLSTGITDVGRVSKSKGVVNFTVKAPGSGTGMSLSYVSRIGGGHLADGASSGDTGGSRGLDAVVDFINYDSAYFGMRFGMAAEIEIVQQACEETGTHTCTDLLANDSGYHGNPYGGTSYATLKIGPLSLGTQATFTDPMENKTGGIANKRSIVAGAALTFGETISVSYGEAWDKYRYNDSTRGGDVQEGGGANLDGSGGEYVSIKYRGVSGAINMGPVALKATRNFVGGWGEAAGEPGQGMDRHHTEVNLSIAF